jgi:hypothetical protein
MGQYLESVGFSRSSGNSSGAKLRGLDAANDAKALAAETGQSYAG